MEKEKIESILKERFSAPLREFYKRRIIFWNDYNAEFSDMIGELSLDNVKILVLTGDNNFYAKYLLHCEDTESDYLIYNTIRYAKPEDNWLHEIEGVSEEFRADLHAMRMNQLNVKESPLMRKTVKLYSKFFENRERTAKLTAMADSYDLPQQMHMNVLAILTGAKTGTYSEIIRCILSDSLYAGENKALANIRSFGNEDVLWEIVAKTTGWTCDEEASLVSLAAHILVTALSSSVNVKKLLPLASLISEENQPACYGIVDDWLKSENENSLLEVAETVNEVYHVSSVLDKTDIQELLKADCMPWIDKAVICRYMNEISENVIKTDEIIEAVEKRRTVKWYSRYIDYYEGLYYAAKLHEFCDIHGDGYHYGEYEEMWKSYCDELYLADFYYRKFHTAFGKSLKNTEPDIDDLFKNVAETVENIYKNSCLSTMNSQWNKLILSDVKCNSELYGLSQQSDFYKCNVKPIIQSNSRVFVIISDALRYETAQELSHRLITKTNGNVKNSAMQSVFPSVTKLGMAALLPHENLNFDENMKVMCDGLSTDGTKQRNAVLKRYCSKNVAVTCQELLAMKQTERRQLISGAECVYIYHNVIDAVGDKAFTETQVFEACEDAVEEIGNLVKVIVNTMNGSNILITADHGFLYSYKPLEEYDKADKACVNGEIYELSRRYFLANGECSADGMMEVSMKQYAENIKAYTPFECIRIKKNGGGMNYVHGGFSLQECVVPLITFKNVRAGSKNYVEITKTVLQHVTNSRKISNNIFSLNFYQTEPVKDKVIGGEYYIYFADENGNEVSDKQYVIADKTDEDNTNRMFRVRFILKSEVHFDRTKPYYLVIADKYTGAEISRTEYTINIVFEDDFGF